MRGRWRFAYTGSMFISNGEAGEEYPCKASKCMPLKLSKKETSLTFKRQRGFFRSWYV